MKNTLVIGPCATCDQIVRVIHRTPALHLNIIGLLDDDLSKHKRSSHSVNVLGGIDNTQLLIKKHNISMIIISIPSANSSQMARIFALYNQEKGISIKTLPGVSNIL